MRTKCDRHDENQGFDVQSSVQRSPLSPLLFEPESGTTSSPSQRMDNPKLQLKRAQEYGFNFSNLPLHASPTGAVQRNAEVGDEEDVATTAQMKGDPTVQRDGEDEEDVAQPKLEGTVQRDGEGEGSMKVVPDGPRKSFRSDVQESFKASGMNNAASTQMIVNDRAAKSMGALAYTTTENNRPVTVAQSKVANDPKLQIHEGTHSEQQAHLNIQPDSSNTLINSSTKYEAEADTNAERFSRGETLSVEGVQLKAQEDRG